MQSPVLHQPGQNKPGLHNEAFQPTCSDNVCMLQMLVLALAHHLALALALAVLASPL